METSSVGNPLPAGLDSAMRRALRRAGNGSNLGQSELEVLLGARGPAFEALCEIARTRRQAHLRAEEREGIVTYSRKVFIPLTRLCRDRCHYCTFVTVPGKLPAAFLELDEVLEIARQGAAAGCTEALFTLGDTPEDRWDAARQWLDERGYDSTQAYLRACAIAVLEDTGLLPHLNPGVMSWQTLQRLRPVAPSMGMMLETTSERLFSERGGPHYGSPDKEPTVRLRTLADAGRVNVPFTSGILIGIGENLAERADSLLALRSSARQYGHLQEVIVQNFLAKPGTAMQGMPDADLTELAVTIAVTRIVLGSGVSVQAPPNLVGGEHRMMLDAGIDDWGGVSPVTPDHVNPEAPWPQVEQLRAWTAEAGFELRNRLTAYPRYVRGGAQWLDPRVSAHVAALAGPDGLASPEVVPEGLPWQEPDGGWVAEGRTDLHASVDTEGRSETARADFATVYGDWAELELPSAPGVLAAGPAAQALRLAERDPAALLDAEHEAEAMALLTARGDDLEAMTEIADGLRAEAVGDAVTYVVNRNINFSNVCYVGCRFCAFAQRDGDADAYRLSVAQVAERAAEAAELGATEVCMQGGIDPKFPVEGYAGLVRAIKQRVPGMHVHAYSPMEIVTAASKAGVSIQEWLTELRDAGLDTIPGTAAEILDDDVRWVLTKGKLPAAQWVEVITTAHRLGLRSSATMMYGHVDHPGHWLGHLRVLAGLQDETGGFTEFVPLPFVHQSSPIYLAGAARPGPTVEDNRAVHAFARIALHGRIPNVQCSWVKLGDELASSILAGGANDLGGTLMEETISRMAGSQHGSRRTIEQLEGIAAAAGRHLVARHTDYAGRPGGGSGKSAVPA